MAAMLSGFWMVPESVAILERRSKMIRRYLQCDICGDKWDITDSDLGEMEVQE
jgi:hypothetical protein